jgi:hypothetical protein
MRETTTTEQITCGGIMGDPEIRTDEKVLMRTQGVHVKSIPFEGILTNRRIILVDRAKNILPPKEIPLATVRDVETGENAVRDLTLSISIIAKTGEIRQMILTFSGRKGGAGERDEWARLIRESTSTSFEQVIRKVIPGADSAQRPSEPAAPLSPEAPHRIQQKKATESIHPINKITETSFSEDAIPAQPQAAAVPSFFVPSPVEEEVVFCTRCGNKVSGDSAFCNKCGSPVVVPAAVPPQPASRQSAAPPSPPVPASHAPSGSSRTIPVEAPLRQSLAWDDETEPATAPPTAARKTEKKGFLAGILSPKKRVVPAPNAPAPAHAAPPARKPRGSLMPGKKTLIAGVIVLIVIAVVVIGAVFVYPMLTSGNNAGSSAPAAGSGSTGSTGSSASTTSGPLTNTGVASITVKETPAPNIPKTGVLVHINYIGSYEGTYGMPSNLQQVPGASAPNSGDQIYEIANATGTVQATIQKEDSSTKHDLIVEIYKNGTLLTSGKTSAAYGRVTISADASTGAALTGNQTAPSPASTATAKAGNTTAAAIQTAAVTAVKTTVPAANTTAKSP